MIINGDSAKELKKFKDNSIDAVITDPPYGIEFLAKEWDSNTGAVEIWQECLRVLKPGGHLLAFSAARTYHHLATNIESVGFEIKDQIMWLYASGFPKAQDIGKAIDKRQGKANNLKRYDSDKKDNNGVDMGSGVYCPKCKKDSTARYFCKDTDCGMIYKAQTPEAQQWSGWKTQLKPAHEPICMARKPFKGSTIDNVLEHGVGALNIDESRIPSNDKPQAGHRTASFSFGHKPTQSGGDGSPEFVANDKGRFPSNVIGEVEGYQKFFYCPKVSRKERHRGCEDIENKLQTHDINVIGKTPLCLDCNLTFNGTNDHSKCDPKNKTFVEKRQPTLMGNNHPTVKPIALMKYLIKLVAPQGSHILDPFAGSGTTGMAAKELGYKFTGIEMDANYVDICIRRIEATKTDPKHTLFK